MKRPPISRAAIAVLAAQGMKYKDIAARVGCSVHTVSDIRGQQKRAEEWRAANPWRPLEGVSESAKATVLGDLERKGMRDVAMMLGLIPADDAVAELTADLRPEMEKAA